MSSVAKAIPHGKTGIIAKPIAAKFMLKISGSLIGSTHKLAAKEATARRAIAIVTSLYFSV